MNILNKWLKISTIEKLSNFNEWKELLDEIKKQNKVTLSDLNQMNDLVRHRSHDIKRILLQLQSLFDVGYTLGIPEAVRILVSSDFNKEVTTDIIQRWINFYNTIPIVKDNFPYDILVLYFEQNPSTMLPFITEDSFIDFIKKEKGTALLDTFQDYLIDQLHKIKDTGEIPDNLKIALQDFFKKINKPIYTTLGNLLKLDDKSVPFKSHPSEENQIPESLYGLLTDLRDIVPDIYPDIEKGVLKSLGEDIGPFINELHRLQESVKNQSQKLSDVKNKGTYKEIQEEIQQTNSVLTTVINNLQNLIRHYSGIYFKEDLQNAIDSFTEARKSSTISEKLQKIDKGINYITNVSHSATQYYKQVQSSLETDFNQVVTMAIRRLIAIRAVLNAFDIILDRFDFSEDIKKDIRKEYRSSYRSSVVTIAQKVFPVIYIKLITKKIYNPSRKESSDIMTIIARYVNESFTVSYDINNREDFINAYKTIAAGIAKIMSLHGTDLEKDIEDAIIDIATTKHNIKEVALKSDKFKSKTVPTKEVLEREKTLREIYQPGPGEGKHILVPQSYRMFYIPFLRTVYEIIKVFDKIDSIVAVLDNAVLLKDTLSELSNKIILLYEKIIGNFEDDKSKKIIEEHITPSYNSFISSVDKIIQSLSKKTVDVSTLEDVEKKVKTEIIPDVNKIIANISTLVAKTKKGSDFDTIMSNISPFINVITEKIKILQEMKFQYPKGTRGARFLIGSLPVLYRSSLEDILKMTSDTFAQTAVDEIEQNPEKTIDIYETLIEKTDDEIGNVIIKKQQAQKSDLDSLSSDLDDLINGLYKYKQNLETEYEKIKTKIEETKKEEYFEEFETKRQETEEGIQETEEPVEIPEEEEAKIVSISESGGSTGSFINPETTNNIFGGLKNVGLWD